MMPNESRLLLSPVPEKWDLNADLTQWNWNNIPTLPPFILARGDDSAAQQTVVRVCYSPQALYVRFDCDDNDIWGTFTQRDDPLYDEEVVELFLAPGEAIPTRYFEFEVSPNGILLDARINNPTSQRIDLEVDISWNCPGIRWQTGCSEELEHWWAILIIPWAAVAPPGALPRIWRANFCRIERPRNAEPEFSCWIPTVTEPADFHKPAFFGTLILNDA